MVTFIIKNIRSFIIPEKYSLINGQNMLVAPSRVIEIPAHGKFETDDKDVIDRIRKDKMFGTERIREITEDDKEAMSIRKKKDKEAEEEIKERKKSRKK